MVLRPTTKTLQRSAHRRVKEFADDIEAWMADWNENPVPFGWHKTAEQILERIAGSALLSIRPPARDAA